MSVHSRESEDTRRKILIAAKREFSHRGFRGARMSSIAKAADVNQALIYYHFSTKENVYKSIFSNIIGDKFEKFSERFFREVESWNVLSDVKLSALIYIMSNAEVFVHDDEFHSIVAHEVAEGKGVIYEYVKQYLLPQILHVQKVISEGMESGVFKISDPLLYSINLIDFTKNFAHGKEYLKEVGQCREIYENRYEILYNYLIEFTSKTLCPEGKDLKIPFLDSYKAGRLDIILNEMKMEVNNF